MTARDGAYTLPAVAILLVHSEGPRGYWSDVIARLRYLGVGVEATTSYRPDLQRAQLLERGLADLELIDVRDLFDPTRVAEVGAAHPPPARGPAFHEAAWRPLRDFLDTTDRSAFLPVSLRHRTRLFRELVRFWDGYLEARPAITAVVFTDVPHHGWDLVLHDIAQVRELRVLSPGTPAITGRVFFRNDYREPPAPPEGYGDGVATQDLLARLSPVTRAALRGESVMAALGRSLIDQPQKLFDVPEDAARGRRGKSGLRAFADTLARGGRNLLEDVFTGEFEYGVAINGIRARVLRKALRQVQRVRFWRLRRKLNELARPVPAGRPYAAFLLHVQPERTTTPDAGRYTDQVLAVETLAAGLPPGWTLAVREHPRQIQADAFNYLQTMHFRVPGDYEAMARLPNVVLSPPDDPVDDLLAGARLISTATGTAGWEGLTLGKPVVCFGYPWYAGCASCHRGDLPGGVAAAVEAAGRVDAAEVVGRDLIVYLAWLEERMVVGSHSDMVASRSDVPFEELVQGMAQGLADILGADTMRDGKD